MANQSAEGTPKHVLTVLLVDSSRGDRDRDAAYLRIAKFRAIEIDDTADALALAFTADVIVTGIGVRGSFDGIELIRRLRADRRINHKPVIVLSAVVSCQSLAHRINWWRKFVA